MLLPANGSITAAGVVLLCVELPHVLYLVCLFVIRYGLVEQENSTLQAFIHNGDNRKARLHAQMVAGRLNRLHGDSSRQQHGLRSEIRHTMLAMMEKLPLRDQVK